MTQAQNNLLFFSPVLVLLFGVVVFILDQNASFSTAHGTVVIVSFQLRSARRRFGVSALGGNKEGPTNPGKTCTGKL